MTRNAAQQTRRVVEEMRARGHDVHAARLERHVATHTVESAVLFALREGCEIILTAVEAIDPVTQMSLEPLRLEVEEWIKPGTNRTGLP
jgi:hypothetical protein